MIKYISVAAFLLFTGSMAVGQNLPNWLFTANLGIEKDDTRRYCNRAGSLIPHQPESWGTYHMEFNVKRKIFGYKRFSAFTGLGIGYEKATFSRPYNQGTLTDAVYGNSILLYVNNYGKLQLPLSFSAFFELSDSWILSGSVASNVLLMRRIGPISGRKIFRILWYF